MNPANLVGRRLEVPNGCALDWEKNDRDEKHGAKEHIEFGFALNRILVIQEGALFTGDIRTFRPTRLVSFLIFPYAHKSPNQIPQAKKRELLHEPGKW